MSIVHVPVDVPYIADHHLSKLMQDNAIPHTARMTMDFLDNHNNPLLPWPTRIPNMKPIQYVGDYIGLHV